MPIIAQTMPLTENRDISEFATPFRDYVGAQYDQSFASNPTALLLDAGDLNETENGSAPSAQAQPNWTPPAPRPRMAKADADARVKEAGVQLNIPQDGITEPALDLLINRQREQFAREDTINRYAGGFAGRAAGLGANLAASLMDPLNVASAFVPVIGEARYTSLLAGAGSALGRLGVRAGVGAAEGAVGAALLEPANYGLHQYLGDDYHLADSLLNIGIGAAGGAVLRGAGGAAHDIVAPGWWRSGGEAAAGSAKAAVDGLGYQDRLGTLKSSVAQMAEGRDIDVDAQIRYSLAARDMVSGRITDADAALRDVRFASDADRAAAVGQINSMAHAEARRIATETIASSERAVSAAEVPGFLRTANDLIALRNAAPTPELAADVARAVEVAKKPGFLRTPEERIALDKVLKGEAFKNAEGGGPAAQAIDAQSINRHAAGVTEAARRTASQESISLADYRVAAAADTRLAGAPKDTGHIAAKAELDEVMARIDALSGKPAAGGESPTVGTAKPEASAGPAELKPFDDAVRDADSLGDAARVAAVCSL